MGGQQVGLSSVKPDLSEHIFVQIPTKHLSNHPVTKLEYFMYTACSSCNQKRKKVNIAYTGKTLNETVKYLEQNWQNSILLSPKQPNANHAQSIQYVSKLLMHWFHYSFDNIIVEFHYHKFNKTAKICQTQHCEPLKLVTSSG